MQTVNTKVDSGTFTGLDDLILYLFGHFRHHFFNTRGVNTSVLHQLMQSQAGYLTTYGIESGKRDGFRGIVYDDFYARCCFQCTDVTSFTTDDTAFHFIILDVENGNCTFCSGL